MDDRITIVKKEEEFLNRLRFYDNGGLTCAQRCNVKYHVQGIAPFTGEPYQIVWTEYLQYCAN